MRAAGLEPTRPYDQAILSRLWLPLHHARLSRVAYQMLGALGKGVLPESG